MSRRFSDNHFRDEDEVSPETFNPVISAFDRAIAALEDFRVSWREQVDLFNTNALKRVNDAVAPIIDQISSAIDGGFLVAQTDDLVAIVEDAEIDFFIPPAARVAYRPTPFLAIMAPDVYDDWAIARTLAYSVDTGLLTVEILHLNGSGAARSGWVISASSGVVEAVSQWLGEISAMHATIIEKAAQVATARTDAVNAANAALPAANVATQKASEVAAHALAIANALAAIAAGPVVSIDGQQGVITGIARRRWVLSQLSLKTDKAFVKSETIKTSRRRANACRLFN